MDDGTSPLLPAIDCQDTHPHPNHEWTSPVTQERLYCHGVSKYFKPGDERQPARQYQCKRKGCGRDIKIIAFNEPDSYCSVNCEKIDKGEDIGVNESNTPG